MKSMARFLGGKHTKAPQGRSFDRAMDDLYHNNGILGFDRAVDVTPEISRNISNVRGGFVSKLAIRRRKVSILAFEVANTIAKGSNLLQSLSEENILFLKKEILHSQGVQLLVSTDMTQLLTIAAADKRDELKVLSLEVIRFGNMCVDPQWHNLDRFFSRLDLDPANHKQFRQEAEVTMQQLTSLAQHTSELYHELHVLDFFDQDYRRRLEEVGSLNLPRRGDSLKILRSEIKNQRKLARNLKKKSLWSKILEEVVEKLVDIVTFIHQEILEVFGDNVAGVALMGNESINEPDRLGAAGLALHYANIITQINYLASHPISIPPHMRDMLYHGLPIGVKTAFRSQLQRVDAKEVLTIPRIKAEMEKTPQWLVPIATNTIKSHQGFGRVGEWANTGSEFGKKTTTNNNIVRLQTLYHADKRKMDVCILELVMWLHRLISQVRFDNFGKKSACSISNSQEIKSFANNEQ